MTTRRQFVKANASTIMHMERAGGSEMRGTNLGVKLATERTTCGDMSRGKTCRINNLGIKPTRGRHMGADSGVKPAGSTVPTYASEQGQISG
jgi:hypothetical protein